MNQIWEYKILSSQIDDWRLELDLNILGQQGWELMLNDTYNRFILKRKTLPISLSNSDDDPQPIEIREELI